MAINRYKTAKYRGTFSCGHEGTVSVGGYSEDYRKNAAHLKFEGVCMDCAAIRRAEEYAQLAEQAAKAAKESNLPELQGSEKQIAWACTIRQQLIDSIGNYKVKINGDVIEELNKFIDENVKKELKNIYKKNDAEREKLAEELNKAFSKVIETLSMLLNNEISAKKYIDFRDEITLRPVYFISRYYETDEEKEKHAREKIEKELEKNIAIEQTIIPNNHNEIIVKIEKSEDVITAIAPKNEKLRLLIKSLGFTWTIGWTRKINEFSGSIEDRMVELGNKLLNEGFGVRYNDDNFKELSRKAKNADYKPECKKWVSYDKSEEKLNISFPRSDKLYRAARKIPGSIYRNGVFVPISSYKSVLDFAEIENFSISDEAIKQIEAYKEAEEKMREENIAIPVTQKEVNKLTEILNTTNEVIGELKDED